MKLFSTEAVSKYHPDKYADQISDAIVTECLRQDADSRCGVEVMVKDTVVVLSGEISSGAVLDINKIVHRVAKKLNYDVTTVINMIGQQSSEINNALFKEGSLGAGDQGIMFGYATSETESMLPKGFEIANKIIARLEEYIDSHALSQLKGDAKTQVMTDLDTDEIVNVVVSVCHRYLDLKNTELLVKDLIKDLVPPEKVAVNPAGEWHKGGPAADCGLTGRKIVCDQYGGYCAVGGGALSGKDPSKVDRTAAYMARKIACDLVKEFKLKECTVQIGFIIGSTSPVSVYVDAESEIDLTAYVIEHYDLTVIGMIQHLGLLEQDYETIAEGCHYFDKATNSARNFEPVKRKDKENDTNENKDKKPRPRKRHWFSMQ